MPMRIFSHQPKMTMWALASLIFDSIRQLKTKLFTDETSPENNSKNKRTIP